MEVYKNAKCRMQNAKFRGKADYRLSCGVAKPYHPCLLANREGERNTTAPCGRNRECELA